MCNCYDDDPVAGYMQAEYDAEYAKELRVAEVQPVIDALLAAQEASRKLDAPECFFKLSAAVTKALSDLRDYVDHGFTVV